MKCNWFNCLLWISLVFISACKTEKTSLEIPNNFGTIYGQGSELILKGVLETSEKDYILWGSSAIKGSSHGFVMKVDQFFTKKWFQDLGERTVKSLVLDDDGNMLAFGDSLYFFQMTYLNSNGNFLWSKSERAGDSTISNCIARKVVFLPNKSFLMAGIVKNTIVDTKQPEIRTDMAMVFTIGRNQEPGWEGYYFDPIFSKVKVEHDLNLLVAADNQTVTMQLFTKFPSFKDENKVNLISIPIGGPVSSVNSWLFNSEPLYGLSAFTQKDLDEKIAMSHTFPDGLALLDFNGWGLNITDNKGKLRNTISFNRELLVEDITTFNDTIMLSIGFDPLISKSNYQGWLMYNLKGEILSSKNIIGSIADNIQITKVFLKPNKELNAFGNIYYPDGRMFIIMLRFNRYGELIK